MCSLFGIYDYKGALNGQQLSKAVNVLAREAEIRGKDATGIAYNHNGKMIIFKRDKPFAFQKSAAFKAEACHTAILPIQHDPGNATQRPSGLNIHHRK